MFSPFRVVLAFIAISVTSFLCIPTLRVNLLPQENGKMISVNYLLFNASPEKVEQDVTSVLENTFSQLRNLKGIKSYSGYNEGSIELEFGAGENITFRKFEVVSILRQLRQSLPVSMSFPTVSISSSNRSTNSSPLLLYAFNGPENSYEIKRLANEIFIKGISSISGVKEVDVSGSKGKVLKVNYDIDKLMSYSLTKSDIVRRLNEFSKDVYPGSMDEEGKESVFFKIEKPIVNIDFISGLTVSGPENTNGVKLGQLATVFIEEQEATEYFRVNGVTAVTIRVYAQPKENIIRLSEQIKNEVEKLKSKMPPGFGLSLIFDDSVYLKKEISKNYRRTVIAILILTVFIFIAYRDWRHILNLLLSLFVNLSLTLILAWYFNLVIHIYTLAGIAIAFGIMTDHAIIMLDYYRQYKNRKVFVALLGATMTMIATLLLIFFLPEEERKELTDFSLIIIFSLFSSLITNLWFTVGMYNLLFKEKAEVSISANLLKKRRLVIYASKYQSLIAFIANSRKSFLIAILLLFGIPLFLLPPNLNNVDWYNKSIGSEIFQTKIGPVVNKWLGGTFRLFKINAYEKGGYRDINRTKIFVSSELPIGNSIVQMNSILIELESFLNGFVGIDKYITKIQSGQSAHIEVTFKALYDNDSYPLIIKSKITNKVLEWSGASWTIMGIGEGFNSSVSDEIPSFRIQMMGYNYDELERQGSKLKAILEANRRVANVNIDEKVAYYDRKGQQYILDINNSSNMLRGNSSQQLFASLLPFSSQKLAITTLNFGDETLPVILNEKRSEEFSKWDVLNRRLNTVNLSVRLEGIAKFSLEETAGTIYKVDRQYVRIVGFEYSGTSIFANTLIDEKIEYMRRNMPVGYSLEKKEHDWEKKKSNEYYVFILYLLVINFVICALLFESLKQPLYIISTIPVSFIGLFLIFYFSGFPFDQGGYAAFIMLGCLVTNAGIFIINDINNVCGIKSNRKMIKAVLNRSRTIILTIIAAICGLLPFLLEGASEVFWFSLALGTTGGLIFSLFAVFLFLPVLLWTKKSTSRSYVNVKK